MMLMGVSVVVAAISIFIAFRMFKSGDKLELAKGGFYTVLKNKYYIDEIYDAIIVTPLRKSCDFFYSIFDVKIVDGLVNGAGKFFSALSLDWRRLQTGIIQDYAVVSVAGIIAIIILALLL
jgi:NADH-quinone oxidoreductase subunit L